MAATRTYPRSGSTRAAIEETALALFEERGFDDVTIDDIADRVGISRRTVFRHFPRKSDIVLDPIAIGFRALPDTLRALWPAMAPAAATRRALAALVEGLEPRRAVLARHMRIVRSSPSLRALSRAMTDKAVDDLRASFLEIEGARSDMAVLRASVRAETMFVIAFGARDQWLTHPQVPIAPAIEASIEALYAFVEDLR